MALTVNREELKELFPELVQMIQQEHIMDITSIMDQAGKKLKPGTIIIRGYFARYMLPTRSLYIQYEMHYTVLTMDDILMEMNWGRTITQVTIYDSYAEYEADRVRMLSSVPADQQTGLNLN